MGAGVKGGSVHTLDFFFELLRLFIHCRLGPNRFRTSISPPKRINLSFFVLNCSDLVEIKNWVWNFVVVQARLHLKFVFEGTTIYLLKVLIVTFHIGAFINSFNDLTSNKCKLGVFVFAFVHLFFVVESLIVVDVCLSLNFMKSSTRFLLENRRLFGIHSLKKFGHTTLQK